MNEIDNFRKIYISCPKPDSLNQRWNQIEAKLGSQRSQSALRPSYLITLIIGTFLLAATAVGAAQTAQPGDNLYSLKILTDNTVANVTNNPGLKVKKRAEDIIKVSDDPKRLEDAIEHYQQTVENAEKKTQKPKDQQKLKQVIQSQEERFKKEAKQNPAFSTKLQELIKEKQRDEDKIKGVKTENKPAEQNQRNTENKSKSKDK